MLLASASVLFLDEEDVVAPHQQLLELRHFLARFVLLGIAQQNIHAAIEADHRAMEECLVVIELHFDFSSQHFLEEVCGVVALLVHQARLLYISISYAHTNSPLKGISNSPHKGISKI